MIIDIIDTYALSEGATSINIVQTGIAWPSDLKHKFANIDRKRQWTDMTNGILITQQFVLNYEIYRALHSLDENSWSPRL